MDKINVLVVDDHQQILESIKNILKTCTWTGIIDVFSDGFSAYANLSKQSYDICIVDLRLPRMDGFALIKQIRKANPKAKIIINTMCEELLDAKRILEIDVEGIVIKASSLAHLKEAIDTVLAGEKYHCPKFRQMEKQQNAGVNINLSKREIEALHAIAEGLTTDEISQMYDMSENTVESIRKRLLLKMGARNMAQLVAKAYKTGVITDYCTDTPPD
jgi:DNA-binding NarL/FixJ family response regulator